jgi:hypothetical protein
MMQSNGHLNVLTRDHDSVVTGYGAHDRVVAFLPRYAEEVKAVAVYVRIDHKWKLGMPTDKQIIRAFKKDQFIRGRWKKALVNDWPEMNATEIFFTQGD